MDPAVIDQTAIQAYKDELAAAAQKAEDRQLQVETAQAVQGQVAVSSAGIQQALINSIAVLIKFMKDNEQRVSVTNHPDPLSLDAVVQAVDKNTQEVQASNQRLEALTGKETDFSAVLGMLQQLEQTIINQPGPPPAPTSVSIDNHPDLTPHFDKLHQALSGINKDLPTPIVNAPGTDLAPIQDQLAQGDPKVLPPNLNLGTYRAHDLDEQDPDIQYIGFVNLDGYWYILKNDHKNNSMRYTFGVGNYADAWQLASTLSYLPLEEAINAIKA